MVNLNVVEDSISVSIGEDFSVVPYNKVTYKRLFDLSVQANAAESFEEYEMYTHGIVQIIEDNGIDAQQLIESKCSYLKYNELTKQYFLTHDDEEISDIPMPQSLVDRIMDSVDKDVDFLPVVKLWTRFLRNPLLRKKGADFAERFADFVNMKYVHPENKKIFMDKGLAENVATDLATVYQIKITNEGLLNGYKVSREVMHKFDAETGDRMPRYKRTFNVDTGEIDSEGLPEFVENRLFEPAVMGSSGDAFFCGDALGHFIRVGRTHKLESWDQVNTDDDAVCVRGLHIGGLYYINGYGGEIHNVFVDPMHIGAIPNSTDGAIRCLQYFVHSSLAGVNGSMYHSSKYAALTDQEWEEMRKEILESNTTTV